MNFIEVPFSEKKTILVAVSDIVRVEPRANDKCVVTFADRSTKEIHKSYDWMKEQLAKR